MIEGKKNIAAPETIVLNDVKRSRGGMAPNGGIEELRHLPVRGRRVTGGWRSTGFLFRERSASPDGRGPRRPCGERAGAALEVARTMGSAKPVS